MDTLQPLRSETPARGRTGLVVGGVIAVVAGVVGALGLWLLAEQQYDDGVEALARAPVGCETVVSIESTGELLVYAELSGRFDDTTGNCSAEGTFRAESDAPTVNVDVTGPDGSRLPVESTSGSEYERGGFRGTQVGRMVVAEPGDHVVRVTSDDGSFALAIGNDPRDGVFGLRAGALAALAAGVVVGLALITAGRRSETPAADGEPQPEPAPPWWESDQAVSAPPERPAAPPRIPGQPSGPGWWDEPGEPAERPRVPGQPSGPGWWDEPGDRGDQPRSPWAPPSA